MRWKRVHRRVKTLLTDSLCLCWPPSLLYYSVLFLIYSNLAEPRPLCLTVQSARSRVLNVLNRLHSSRAFMNIQIPREEFVEFVSTNYRRKRALISWRERAGRFPLRDTHARTHRNQRFLKELVLLSFCQSDRVLLPADWGRASL